MASGIVCVDGHRWIESHPNLTQQGVSLCLLLGGVLLDVLLHQIAARYFRGLASQTISSLHFRQVSSSLQANGSFAHPMADQHHGIPEVGSDVDDSSPIETPGTQSGILPSSNRRPASFPMMTSPAKRRRSARRLRGSTRNQREVDRLALNLKRLAVSQSISQGDAPEDTPAENNENAYDC